jgi:menaquinone-dependent protoporphyrinogen oxidase
MRVLVTWGSERGGTEGIARTVGEALREDGFEVMVLAPQEAARAKGFDAAIVGGALYAGRWHRKARNFVTRRETDLRRVPVWFFSSGPLDDSAELTAIPPTRQVKVLMERVGALGHATFGGRLAPDARGFPASAMAKKHAGDWRNDAHIRNWASTVSRALPLARPGVVVAHPGGSIARLVGHAVVGWAVCAVTMALLLSIASKNVAIGVHAFVVPVVFGLVAKSYFA